MSHNHEEYPIIWSVNDTGSHERLTTLVNHTREEAVAIAKQLFPNRSHYVSDTGKRKPPNKCCNTCGAKPCGS
jgi:hypothetical protein